MKHIGLFCGSFNPVHIGHTTLAQTILNKSALDEIWFVVSPQNPLKQKSQLASEQDRLMMVNLALRNCNNMHSCDVEFSLPKPSFTANTLRHLSQLYPDYAFTLIIGSDNLQVFNLWRQYDFILNNYHIIVYPRQGDNLQQLLELYPQVSGIEAPLLPVSSTRIRALFKANAESTEAKQWLEKSVWEYITRNRIY